MPEHAPTQEAHISEPGTGSGIFSTLKHAVVDVVKRVTKKVEMDDAKAYDWGPNDEMETTGISVCSVLVIYTRAKVGMAHIPQGRIVGDIYMAGEQVITALTGKLRTEFGNLAGATGVLYHHPSLDAERIRQIKKWATDNGAVVRAEPFGTTIRGSGTFSVRRFGDAWPPYHNPPL